MTTKRSLENRIRGWFPKEPLRVSFQADILYSEWVSVGKFVRAIVGSISVLALFVLTISIWVSISIQNPLFAVIFAFPLIFLLILYVNYRGVQIIITSKELIVSYGILNRKRIAISDIVSCEHTKANFGKYLGVGIRYGTDGSWAYSTSFSNAIKINQLRGRPFVFSSNNPDKICSTISQMKQPEKDR
ncbi:hypothetical protein JXA31_09355 [Candidatus Bathyarchaeota archaeon]|nr:hypothetical protein [Candidatus Bathyarchaeota archaeon]